MCVRKSSLTESSSGPVLFTAFIVINSSHFLGKLLTSQNLVRLAWHCLCCVDVLNSAKLNAVHELSLCLTVPSSAWKWHRAGMNWKSEWLYEHKDRWQDPHWNVWPHMAAICFHSRVVSRHTVTAVQLQWDLLPKLPATVGQCMVGLPGQTKSKTESEESLLPGTGCRRSYSSE